MAKISFDNFIDTKQKLSRRIWVDALYVDLVDDLTTEVLLNQIIY